MHVNFNVKFHPLPCGLSHCHKFDTKTCPNPGILTSIVHITNVLIESSRSIDVKIFYKYQVGTKQ